jgi:hypothetical protein
VDTFHHHVKTSETCFNSKNDERRPLPEGYDSGIIIQHYFGRDSANKVTDAIINEGYELHKDAFKRRANQMSQLLQSTGPHLYVWLTDANWYYGRSAREASRDFLNLLRSLYPLHQCDLLTVQLETKRELEWHEENIFNRYVPNTIEGWIGNNSSWDKLFANFTIEK